MDRERRRAAVVRGAGLPARRLPPRAGLLPQAAAGHGLDSAAVAGRRRLRLGRVCRHGQDDGRRWGAAAASRGASVRHRRRGQPAAQTPTGADEQRVGQGGRALLPRQAARHRLERPPA